MRLYEIMLILPADADDKVVGGVTDRIGRILAERGGEVVKTDRWGRRRFAQEMMRQTEGYYLVLEMRAEPEALTELDRVLALADDVLRFKVVVLPEKHAAAKEAAGQGAQEATAGQGAREATAGQGAREATAGQGRA
jgi:small subunit ribosomal protein S6